MPYCQLFYHIVWSTKNRQPFLLGEVEAEIYGYLRSKAAGLEAKVFALNGITDHVHMVVSIPPKIAVATFIGQIKAVAATRFNKAHPDAPIAWQNEYGVFSFDRKRLPNYIAYTEHQKEHHAQQDIIACLERIDTATIVHEPPAEYWIIDRNWRKEMETAE